MLIRYSLLACVCLTAAIARADDPPPIHVVVWDERQPEQKEAYDGGFLGDYIAAELRKLPGLAVTSVGLDDPEQGLPDTLIDQTEVLIWWSHVRDAQFDAEKAQRIARRVQKGRLALIVLHSGFAGRPFQLSIQERLTSEALNHATTVYPDSLGPLEESSVTYLRPGVDYPFTQKDTYSPEYRFEFKPGRSQVRVRYPAFTIQGWREDGKPSHVRVVAKGHPIVAGLRDTFDIPRTEMYNEPFHVPEPSLVLLEETWDSGERFRSGCLWRLGDGAIFYFRPGHETYPVFKNPEPMKILENAVRYLAAENRRLLQSRENEAHRQEPRP